MAGYGNFARYYNLLTGDVDYRKMAAHIHGLLTTAIGEHRLLLDLACGTGNLSIGLSSLGYDVIGVDASPEMLSVAAQRSTALGLDILFLCQAMEELDLYGTVDAVVCTLDSLNHILDEQTLKRVFERVALFLNPDGLFIFDVNTPYKHGHILGDNCYVREEDNVYCVWQNHLRGDMRVEMDLDFFEKQANGQYLRVTEHLVERAYPRERLEEWLFQSGLCVLSVSDGYSARAPLKDCQRYLFVAQMRSGERNNKA
jgi:SAM-dependent methyltransferase